jgi:lysophospholipase L1-like esterase
LPEAFSSGLKDVIGRCKEAGATVVLCTPTVIGEKKEGANRQDARLDQYADISRGLAKELKLPLCDLRKAFIDYIKDHNPKNEDKNILTNDTVHLNQAGDKFVAETMLKVIDH